MSNEIVNTGFDSPKIQKDQDLLGRWDFAKELYDLLTTTPKEWSVRVGVYGGWGEGKTTILNFIDSIAKSKNQIVIRFNPWEYQSSAEMWESFTSLLYNTLSDLKLKIKLSDRFWFNTRVRIRRIFRNPINFIEPLSKINQYAEYGVPILKNFLSFNKKNIRRIPKIIKDKKVIVLVDDLDRTHPILITQFLFSLKELMDLPGLSFVVGFDPDIVNLTLKENNIKYGDGKDYLEKIIEFPRWIPKPNDEQLRNLIKYEVEEDLNFIPTEAFIKIFDYLPKNPRKLKQFIRSFLGFKKEINRYERQEINWSILLLLNLLKVNYPSIADLIVKNQKIWKGITTDKWFGERYSQRDRVKEYEEELKTIYVKYDVAESDQEKILNLIKEIAETNFPLTVSGLDSYTYLTERRNILTWKEYNKLLLDFEKNPSVETINIHLNSINIDESFSREVILQAILLKAVEYRIWSLGMASDSIYELELNSHTNDSILGLDIIRRICFDMNGFIGKCPFLAKEHFVKIYEMFTRWAHFTMPNIYRLTREKEKEFIKEICEKAEIELMPLMEYIQPWMPYRASDVFDPKAETELAKQLGLILELRISEQLLEKFLIENWTFNIILRDGHVVEHYILLRKSSPFWQGELRNKLLNMLNEQQDNITVEKSMYHFLILMESNLLENSGKWSVIKDEDEIIRDTEVITKIWEVAMKRRINPRMFRSIEKFRDKLKAKTNIELPKPEWWDEIKRMVEGRVGDNDQNE